MSIASMLNSPVAPTFTRADFQRRVVQDDSTDNIINDSVMMTPPRPSLLSPSSETIHKDLPDADHLPPQSLSPRRDSSVVADNTEESSGNSVPPSSVSPINRNSESRVTPHREVSGEPSTPRSSVMLAPEEVTPSLSSNHDRPETPIPMVIPPTLMSRSWRSPTPTPPSHESTIVKQEPFIYPELPDTAISQSIPPPVDGHELESSFQISSPSPIVIRGRLVTPPSREDTPVPSGSSSKTVEEDSDEGQEQSEKEVMEQTHIEKIPASLTDNSDSDSLTPAPSPRPLIPDEEIVQAPPDPTLTTSTAMDETPDSPTVTAAPDGETPLDKEEPNAEASDGPIPSVAISSPTSTSMPPRHSDHESSHGSPIRKPDTIPPLSPTVESVPPQKPIVDTQKLQSTEELSAPASAQIRRTTLKDYARRRKNQPHAPPSNASTSVSESQGAPPLADLQTLSVNMPENDQAKESSSVNVAEPTSASNRFEMPSQVESSQKVTTNDYLPLRSPVIDHQNAVCVYPLTFMIPLTDIINRLPPTLYPPIALCILIVNPHQM
ncbi:hypothetical protein CPB86DRAFT_604307 [Serendipita vermifera]|nr:hypothetical protein CPB86DRAFT_604307 [Serendipita vermifera]